MEAAAVVGSAADLGGPSSAVGDGDALTMAEAASTSLPVVGEAPVGQAPLLGYGAADSKLSRAGYP